MKLPKIGTIFLHGYWIEADTKKPLTCQVTAIRLNRIYYKTHGRKKAIEKCKLERWPAVCKEILKPETL